MLPDCANTFKGRIIIVGSAACVWDDLKELDDFNSPVMCINDMICYYPNHVMHAWTNNENRLDGYWFNRRKAYKDKYRRNDGTYRKPMMHTLARWNEHIGWPFQGNGTSTLNAIKCADGLGYDEIILCGCPMDGSTHFWECPWGEMPKGREFNKQFEGDQNAWVQVKKNFGYKVRSMSGNTKELFG